MLVFENKGLIDVQSITTFGVSSKESDNPIGFFGTGLKYAIAVILRLGGTIDIYRETKKYSFSVKKKRIRVNDFNIVHMNNKPIGFTTELGKTWEAWQAYRELACNAYDEGGTIWQLNEGELPFLEQGTTTIIVNCTELESVHEDNDIFITSEPIEKSAQIEIHNGISPYIYYRGVKAFRLSKPSLVTYNILETCDLTEDRTLKYSFQFISHIEWYYAKQASEKLLQTILSAQEAYFESVLDFSGISMFGSNFLKVCGENFQKRSGFNKHAISIYMKETRKDLSEKRVTVSKVENKCLDKAVYFCKQIGYNVEEYPIIVVDHLGQCVFGLAENGTIYLSNGIFDKGSKFVASTLIEEYIHLKEGFCDCSRELQTYLFDKIITMGEQITGEVL